jgi:hypothetical protein
VGAALGKADCLLLNFQPPAGIQAWHWVDPLALHLDVELWVRSAVRAAVEEPQRLEQAVPCICGVLHAGPEPEAFPLNERGKVGIIDWGSVTVGPLLHDVASSRRYSGLNVDFSPFSDKYLRAEQLAAIPAFFRFRGAVHADYFARRIWREDYTGIESHAAYPSHRE